MNVLAYLDSKNISYRLVSGNGEAVLTCPVCGREGKFYVSVETGAFKCFRASCDTHGGWRDLVKLLGDEGKEVELQVVLNPRELPDPEPIPPEVVQEHHQFLLERFKPLESYFTDKRGYSPETVKKFSLGWDGRNILIPIYDEKENCVNFKHKPDPTRPNASKGMFSIEGRGRMRLFNAKVLLGEQKPDEIIIAEGEWDTMKLDQEGYVAVSSTGGTGSFKPEWLSLFQGVKKIFVCQDNDANGAGQSGAKKIAQMFLDQKIATFIVNLPNPKAGVEEKVDVTDVFTRLGKTKEHFDLLLQTAQPFQPSEEEKEKFRLSDYLCELAIGAGVKVFLDQMEEPHLTLPEEPLVAYPVVGGRFRGWLSARYWGIKGVGFSGDTYKEVVDTLSAKAHYEGKPAQLWNRIAIADNIIYYDLGDGRRVVKIDKNGWQIDTKSPVKFKRFYHQVVQVEPDRVGDVAEVAKFVNLRDNKDKLLYLTYLVAGLNPIIPRALLTLYGDKGSAKSTALRVARSIIDPSNAGKHPSKTGNLLSPPKDETDLAGKSSRHYCLYFDNLSYCPDWLSDAFARLVTGASFSKRKLYTDADEVTFNEMPLLGMDGITLIAEKPDLLDRLLILEMERIPEEERKTEGEFWRGFHEALPRILGGLFTVLSKTLAVAENLDLGILPRMADYAAFAAAAAIALGSNENEFLQAFNQNIKRQNQTAIESSPVAQVVLQFMESEEKKSDDGWKTGDEWSGTSTALYKKLLALAETMGLKIGGSDGFPKSSHWLWKKMQQVKSNLGSLGVKATREEESTASVLRLVRTSKDMENTATAPNVTISGSKDSGNISGSISNNGKDIATDIEAEVATEETVAAIPLPLEGEDREEQSDYEGVASD